MPQEFKRIQSPQGEIILRAFEEKDIPSHLTFYYDSPPGFMESIGLNPKGFPPHEELAKQFKQRAEKNPQNIIIAELNGVPVGSIFLDMHHPDGVPRLHFFIFDPQDRHKGLGTLIAAHATLEFAKIAKTDRFLLDVRASNKVIKKMIEKVGKHVKDYHQPETPILVEMESSQYEIFVKDIEAFLNPPSTPKKPKPSQP